MIVLGIYSFGCELMRRAIPIAAVSLLLTAAVAFAQADSVTDVQLCYRTHSDLTLRIHYCTNAIESGKLQPRSLSISYVNRGSAYEAKGEYERALADYNSAVKADEGNAQADIALASFYRSRGQETKAIEAYDKAISLPVDPTEANGYLNRARAERGKGNYTAALADLDSAGKLDPKYREVYLERASIHSARRVYAEAIADYDAALAIDPKDAMGYSLRGDAYEGMGNYRRALKDYDAAVALEPGVPTFYADRGGAYMVLGQADSAVLSYTKAIRLDPKNGSRYTDRASAYRILGDWKKAMADYATAIETEPDRGGYYDTRADARQAIGDYAGALADRDAAIKLDATDADLRVSRGWTLLYMGRTADALAAFADAIALDPRAPGRRRSRGLALARLGRFDAAFADYDSAIALQPERGANYVGRAYVFVYQRKPLDGLPDLARAESADREYAIGIARGRLLSAGMKMDSAIAVYGDYITRRPNSVAGYWGRALANMVQGDLHAAIRDFDKELELDPTDTDASLARHWCRARLGLKPDTVITSQLRRIDPTVWPAPALRFASGKLTLEQLLLKAKDPSTLVTREHLVEAYFYAGEYYLALRQNAKAAEMFKKAMAQNTPWFMTEAASQAELAALAQ